MEESAGVMQMTNEERQARKLLLEGPLTFGDPKQIAAVV